MKNIENIFDYNKKNLGSLSIFIYLIRSDFKKKLKPWLKLK